MLVLNTIKNTERVFKNKAALGVAEMEKKHPGELDKILPLIKGALYREAFQETGDTDSGVWSCGQSIGLINSIPTCAVLIANIVKEAEDRLRRSHAQLMPSKL
jgi:nitronate monooxygenase